MNNCINLSEIDLTNLVYLNSISDMFLYNCKTITSVKLPSNITSIGYGFINGCEKLLEIDLSTLKNLTSIDDYNFLYGSYNLQTIILNNSMNNDIINMIKNNFKDKTIIYK